MDKYNNFVDTVDRLKTAVANMKKAKTREEIEALEQESRTYFNGIMGKVPYIQADIHSFALEQMARVNLQDAKAMLEK